MSGNCWGRDLRMENNSKRLVALLRGVNVGGKNKVPMAQLCSVCADCGCADVRSYIQSGNLVFRSSATSATLEGELERAIKRCFGIWIVVIVRTSAQWSRYLKENPFPEASRKEPNRVMLVLAKVKPAANAAGALRQRAEGGERVAEAGDALWIHFPAGLGKSKLAPGALDRFVGSPVTMRNWRTVVTLGDLAAGKGSSARASGLPTEKTSR